MNVGVNTANPNTAMRRTRPSGFAVRTPTYSCWFFVFGFEKNERDNISDEELEGRQTLASSLLALSTSRLDAAVTDGTLQEILP